MKAPSAENELIKIRKKIDSVDEQIAKLIQKRLLLTEKAIALKIKKKTPLQDKRREKKILKNYLQRLRLQSSSARVKNFVETLLRLYPKL